MKANKKLDIDTIIKILYNIRYNNKFYFLEYGKDIIKSYVKQENKELIEEREKILLKFADYITHDIFSEFANEDLVKMFIEKYNTNKK